MRFLPALALGFSLFSTTAHAEDAAACPAKATILSLSDAVLADRDKLPRLKARGYGAEAAYLKIRYGALPMEMAADLAHGLRDAGVREALDLAGAIDATRGGFDALNVSDPVQLSAAANSRATAALPTPSGPENNQACGGRSDARARSSAASACVCPMMLHMPPLSIVGGDRASVSGAKQGGDEASSSPPGCQVEPLVGIVRAGVR